MTGRAKVKTGDDVTYKWGNGTVSGEVTQVHTRDVKKTIKWNTVKRAASKREPAVEIETAKGKTVLKSASEVTVKSA
jgi:Hypervirulence associated proteins TUDOR domain